LFAALSRSSNLRVFNYQFVQVALFVDALNQFTLCDFPTFIYKERHDGLWDEICNLFLHKIEVRLNEVLNYPSFHDDATALLVSIGPHLVGNCWQNNWWKVSLVKHKVSSLLVVLRLHGNWVIIILSSSLGLVFFKSPGLMFLHHLR
jgi:hypothetical protein